MPRLVVSSVLPASADEVWAAASTLSGVNDELWPFVRMTTPRGLADGALRPGAIGRSWLLLGGVLPFDYDDLVLERVHEGRGFEERSQLASASVWAHDRTLEPLPGGGCRVRDVVTFTPRVVALAPVQGRLVAAMFRWRHRRLRGRWGVTQRR